MKKFTRIVSFLLVLCMVLSIAPALSFARAADTDADLWVDPVNGDDTNDGTTEDKALKTIQAAKTKAAELSANGDVVVILMGGTYDATETITFGASDSGRNGNTITYRAASGETVLISGGKELDGWTLHDAANNIYVTDIPEGAELLDIGSGAGFPALPLAIIRPDIKVTALDSTEKKVEYIRTTAEILGLQNVSTLYGRAEELSAAPAEEREKSERRENKGKKARPEPKADTFMGLRESFDIVIARSVASYNLLSELCIPFLKVGGKFISMKGEKALHEAKEGENALYLLGCVQKCEIVKPYSIDPETDKLFFVTTKRSKTPAKYPRKYAQIKKKPL